MARILDIEIFMKSDTMGSNQDNSGMEPNAYRYLAQSYIRDAQESGTYFGDRKVFLCTIPGLDLADTTELDAMRRMGLLEFARADYVQGMDPTLVQASEWSPMRGVQFHFLVVA